MYPTVCQQRAAVSQAAGSVPTHIHLSASQYVAADQLNAQKPDLSLLRPELQQQWLHSKNTAFGTKLIKPGSNSKAWWQRDQCPEGIPYIWTTEIRRRSAGTGCPFCASKRVCKCNSLATQTQAVAMSWDYIKNGTSPQQFCQFSNKSARRKCWQCGHEWTAKIRSRVLRHSGCPMCYLSSGQQKLGKRLSSLADSKPAFMAEWHPTMNTKDGIKPENLKLGSSRLAWWSCTKCPKDQPHVWQASQRFVSQAGAHSVPTKVYVPATPCEIFSLIMQLKWTMQKTSCPLLK